jgi:hypothetical protein
MPGQARRNPGQAGAQYWPELEDDVHRGPGDLPEPTEAGVAGQLAYCCRAGALRHKLGDHAVGLQTVRGAGYRFTTPP